MKLFSLNQKLWGISIIIAAIPAIFFLLGFTDVGGGIFSTISSDIPLSRWLLMTYILPGLLLSFPFVLNKIVSPAEGTNLAAVFSILFFACCCRGLIALIQKFKNK